MPFGSAFNSRHCLKLLKLSVRQHRASFLKFGIDENRRLAELALSVRCFLGKNVASECMPPLDFSGSG